MFVCASVWLLNVCWLRVRVFGWLFGWLAGKWCGCLRVGCFVCLHGCVVCVFVCVLGCVWLSVLFVFVLGRVCGCVCVASRAVGCVLVGWLVCVC